MRVLFIDQDRDLTDLLSFTLKRAGLAPVTAHDFNSAQRVLTEQSIDVIVLDPSIPMSIGRDPIRELKRRNPTVPVIVLSTKGAERDRVEAFEYGADDYVVKPFSHRELVARIRARLRGRDPMWFTAKGGITDEVSSHLLDVSGPGVLKDGHRVPLSATEERLLRLLIANPGRVVPRQLLAKHVSEGRPGTGSETLRVVLHRLRRKLVAAGLDETLLETVPGVGVKFVPTKSQSAVVPTQREAV